jgi:glycine C-acetyltransferase
LPPASAAASLAAFEVIEEEPERSQNLQRNYFHFSGQLREAGFDLLRTETAIIPVMCGELEKAVRLARYCQDRHIFVQAIIAPVVPEGQARLRATVCATHTIADLDYCAQTLIAGAREIGGIL